MSGPYKIKHHTEKLYSSLEGPEGVDLSFDQFDLETIAVMCNRIHAAALSSLDAGELDLGQFAGITPGEWIWQSFDGGKTMFLGTVAMGRLIVMDFVRKGTQGACPRFSDRNGERRGGIMHPHDMTMIEHHPDARAIAAVPKMLAEIRRLRAELKAKEDSSG